MYIFSHFLLTFIIIKKEKQIKNHKKNEMKKVISYTDNYP